MLNENIIENIWPLFRKKFNYRTYDDFMNFVNEYENIKPFKACENIFETGQTISPEAHFIMRCYVTNILQDALKAMKIDLNDANIAANHDEGNIGTAGRITKCWVGGNINDDTELGSGRFMKPVRIATFPNENKNLCNTPITKKITINSNCSHHFIPFSTTFDNESYAIVSYIPEKKILGISKLQRLADFVSRRFWLQEDLTRELFNQISKAAETENVYVKLYNVKHGCEWLRGAKNPDGGLTTEYFGGIFKDKSMRDINK